MTRARWRTGLGIVHMVLRKEPTYTVMTSYIEDQVTYKVCRLVKKEPKVKQRWKEVIAEFINEEDAILFRDACNKTTPVSGHARYIEGRAEERNEIVEWLRKRVGLAPGFAQLLAKMIENGEHKL